MLTPSAYKRRQTMRRQTQRYGFALLLLTVIFFGLLLTGCGESLPKVHPVPMRIPEPPPTTMEAPPQSYQQSALTLLQRWQAMLTGGEAKQ